MFWHFNKIGRLEYINLGVTVQNFNIANFSIIISLSPCPEWKIQELQNFATGQVNQLHIRSYLSFRA